MTFYKATIIGLHYNDHDGRRLHGGYEKHERYFRTREDVQEWIKTAWIEVVTFDVDTIWVEEYSATS